MLAIHRIEIAEHGVLCNQVFIRNKHPIGNSQVVISELRHACSSYMYLLVSGNAAPQRVLPEKLENIFFLFFVLAGSYSIASKASFLDCYGTLDPSESIKWWLGMDTSTRRFLVLSFP